jgi:nicotinamidase-related amidase
MKALLLIDIQNDYFEGGAMPLVGMDQAASCAAKKLAEFRRQKLPVIHIQHVSQRKDATFFLPGTKGMEIHPSVAPIEGERVIEKNFPNAFRETDLLEYLQQLDIDELVICGAMTHMCIDTTVRAAFDLRFKSTVIKDACATKDLEFNGCKVVAADVQAAYLAGLSYVFASIY